MEISLFNINHGFTEAIIRGLRSGFLTEFDYRRLSNCDNMTDLRSALAETDYGNFLQDEPENISSTTVVRKCREKLADEFRWIKAQSVEPLSTFLEFIARERMIDNVIMILQCILNNKAPVEMAELVHPLGTFEGMSTMMSEKFDVTGQGAMGDIYRIFLEESPIGPYFDAYIQNYMQAQRGEAENPNADMAQMAQIAQDDALNVMQKSDLEFMKFWMRKAWLEDFHEFSQQIGGTTAKVMGHILSLRADFTTLTVTLNSLSSDITVSSAAVTKDQRNKLFPNFGYLMPEGTFYIKNKVEGVAELGMALEKYPKCKKLFEQVKPLYEREGRGDRKAGAEESIEDAVYRDMTFAYEMAFEEQFHFALFYAWVKLREQENRNIEWIANMITLNKKEQIDSTIIPLFKNRA